MLKDGLEAIFVGCIIIDEIRQRVSERGAAGAAGSAGSCCARRPRRQPGAHACATCCGLPLSVGVASTVACRGCGVSDGDHGRILECQPLPAMSIVSVHPTSP